MHIGLTFDLRSAYLAMGYTRDQTAEFDREDTIEGIEAALNMLGHTTERIGNARELAAALVAGRRWDLVFNIAEGLSGVGREAQVPALLDLYHVPYTFSDPLVMALTLHKGMTKRVIRDAGIPTADFAVADDPEHVQIPPFAPPYFVKPVAEGTGKGITPESIVREATALPGVCRRLILTYGQPVLIEPYLPGREFTVGIVGTGTAARVLGTIEVILRDQAEQGVYSYANKENYEELVQYRLVDPGLEPVVAAAESVSLRSWRTLGCRDAGRIDIRCDACGNPMFMEVNPLAGIHPEHSDLPIICTHLGLPYHSLISDIVDSARARVELRN